MTMGSTPLAPDATITTRSTVAPPASRRRSVLAGFVLVLACISILATTIAVWTHQVALNTDRFTALVSDVVAEPTVIAPISTRLSTQVVDAIGVEARLEARLPDVVKPMAPALTESIRSAIDKRLQIILANPKVQAALLNAVSFTHAQVVRVLRGDPENVNIVDGYVTLDVFPLVGAALAQLQEDGIIPAGVQLPDLSSAEPPAILSGRLATALGITLPEDFGTIQLMPADKILAARAIVQAFDIIVIVLIALSIILSVLAVWLARRRRRMVVFLALGTIVALVLARLAINTAQGVIVGGIADKDLAEAAQTVLGSVFADLRGVMLIVLIATAVVGVVAYLLGRPRWAVSATSTATGAARQAGATAGAAAVGGASAGRSGFTEAVRTNRAMVEKIGLVVVAFIVVWVAIGLEVALLVAALVIGLELLLNAISPSEGAGDEAATPVADEVPPVL